MNSPNIHISEITIQNQKMTFSSSSASPMYTTNYEGYMQLQHFIENGLDITSWNEVDLSNIVIGAYVQDENEEFPLIDLSKELDITLKINKAFKQVLINQLIDPIKLEFGEMEKDNKFYFYDDIAKKNRIFYINEIKHHDIWEEVNNKFKDEWAKALPKEQLENMKENFINSLDRVCPKGMDLALLQYETEDNIQLDFYSKEYLDKKLVYNDSASAMGVLFGPDEEFGKNGFKNRICMIKPVEKDFNGSLEIELLSWYKEIGEEIIKV